MKLKKPLLSERLIFLWNKITWVFTVFAKIPTYAALMAVYGISWFFTMIFLIIAYRFYIKNLKEIKH